MEPDSDGAVVFFGPAVADGFLDNDFIDFLDDFEFLWMLSILFSMASRFLLMTLIS